MNPILKVQDLNVSFKTPAGKVQVLRDVNFELRAGESLGIVGESGSGKSITSLAIMDLLPTNLESKTGLIQFFDNQGKNTQFIRGKDIAMVFQDPMTSLNPCFTVQQQIAESLTTHGQNEGAGSFSKAALRDKVIELLGEVGIPDPASRLSAYPHELSGGMSQRVMIAMAMACRPKVLIADEPTTALDVTIQKQILNLMNDLRKKKGMSLILISHDLGVIAQNSDRMLVMYAGEVVESGFSKDVILKPNHPYTKSLLNCLPGRYFNLEDDFRLPTIPGIVPNLLSRPSGCQLEPRCYKKKTNCSEQKIAIREMGSSQKLVRCLYPEGDSL